MKLIHAANYYPPPPVGIAPPVRVEISFDPERVDRSAPIPRWLYSFEIWVADFRGIAQAGGGSVEAVSEDQAVLRIYTCVIDTLAEMLAARVARPA